MATSDVVSLHIRADGAQTASNDVARLGGSVRALAADVAHVTTAFSAVLYGVQQVAGGVSSLTRVIDTFSNVESRLRLVASGSAALVESQSQLFAIAQRNRTSYADLAETYSKFATATSNLGVSQQRLLGITESISRAVTISGGSAESTKAALIQLGQGMSAGVLRGQELNSVLEQTPRLARALAEGLGIGVGQLRKLGEEGKITAQAVVQALEKSAPQLAAEFAKMTPTVAGSFTTLKDAAGLFISEFDKGIGGSQALAEAMRDLGKNLGEAAKGAKEFAEDAKPFAEFAAWSVGGLALASALHKIAAGLAAVGAAGAAGGAVSVLGRLAPLLTNPVGWAGAAIGGVAYGISQYEESDTALQSRIGQVQVAIANEYPKDRRSGKDYEAAIAHLQKLEAQLAARRPDPNAGRNAASQEGRQDLRAMEAEYAAAAEAESKAIKTAADAALKARQEAAKKGLALIKAGMAAEIDAIRAGEKEKLDLIAHAEKMGTLSVEQAGEKRVQAIAESSSEQIASLIKIANAQKAAGDSAGYIATEKEIAEAVRKVAGASLDAAKALELYNQKQAESDLKVKDDFINSAFASADAVRQQADALELQVANFGLSDEAIYRNLAAQALLNAEENRAFEGSEAYVATLEAKAKSYERMADAAGSLAGKKLALEEAEKASQAWKDFSRDIEQSLTDSLYRAFESGESFGDAFAKNLEATFKTMVLKATIQSVVSPVMNSLGLSSLAGGASGSGGMLSSLFSGTSMGAMGAEFAAGFSSTLPAGVAGPTMAGAGGAAGFGASVSTAMPYIAAAAAAYYVAEKYTKGETRSGQEYILGAKGIEIESERGGGAIAKDALTALSNAAIKTTNNLLDRYADTQIATFRSKLETSGKGRGGVFAGGTLEGGASFGEWNSRFESTSGKSLNSEEAQAAYALDLMQSTLQALRAADIGGEIGTLLASTMETRFEEVYRPESYRMEGLNEVITEAFTETVTTAYDQIEALTAQQAGALIAAFDAGLVDDLIDNFGDVSPTLEQVAEAAGKLMAVQPLAGLFDALGVSLVKFGPAVAEALGGVDAAGSALGTYFANFYTEGEQAGARAAALTKAWANDLNLMGAAMPTTAAGFRDLVEGLDLADEAQLKTYASLMNLSGAFAEVYGSAESVAQASRDQAEAARKLAEENAKLIASYTGIKQGSETLFMSANQSLNIRTNQSRAEFESAGLAVPASGADYRALIAQQDEFTEAGRRNLDLLDRWSGTFGEWLSNTEDELQKSQQTIADNAAKEQADAIQKARSMADERGRIEAELLMAQGDVAAMRKMELDALDPANRALKQSVFALLDFKEAAAATDRVLNDLAGKLSAANSRVLSATNAVEAVQGTATNQYLSDLSKVEGLQKRISALQLNAQEELARAANETARQMGDLGKQLREYIAGARLNDDQNFSRLLTSALGGNTDAMAALPAAARAAADAAELTATTKLDAVKAQNSILAGLAKVAALAESKSGLQSTGAGSDPVAEARSELRAAQKALAESLSVVTAIDAPLTKTVTDLISKFVQAQDELKAAKASATALDAAIQAIKTSAGKIDTNTNLSASTLSAVEAAISVTLADKFDALDSSVNGLLSYDEFKTGFTGLASEETLKRLFDSADANGDGQLTQLEAIAKKDFNPVINIAAPEVTVNPVFDPNDPMRSVFDSIKSLLLTTMVLSTGHEFGYDQTSGAITPIRAATFEGAAIPGGTYQFTSQIRDYSLASMDYLKLIDSSTNAAAASLRDMYDLMTTPDAGVLSLFEENALGFYNHFYNLLVDIRANTLSSSSSNALARASLDKIVKSGSPIRMVFDRGTATGGAGGQVFASGGAFTNSIVSRPTSFNMGLMGEAGPEAIMPLSNIGGKLGIHATTDPAVKKLLTDLIAEVQLLRSEAKATARHTARTAQSIDSVITGGETMKTEAAV